MNLGTTNNDVELNGTIQAATVNIDGSEMLGTLTDGGNQIEISATKATITGPDTYTALLNVTAQEVKFTGGTGDDKITVEGTVSDADYTNGAKLDIDTGLGDDIIYLNGVTALSGSKIVGGATKDIIRVMADINLAKATISNIDNIIAEGVELTMSPDNADGQSIISMLPQP